MAIFTSIFLINSLTALLVADQDKSSCLKRCFRLYERSLNRMAQTVENVQRLLPHNYSAEDKKKICWKSFDFMDCSHQCESSDNANATDLSNFIKSNCFSLMKDSLPKFECIRRYHSFVEIRCSSHLDEAVRLKIQINGSTKEICRHFQNHNVCLSRNVNYFCPEAFDLFTEENLQNYFYSYILPKDEEIFNDEFLRQCHIYAVVEKEQIFKDIFKSKNANDEAKLQNWVTKASKDKQKQALHTYPNDKLAEKNEIGGYETTFSEEEIENESSTPTYAITTKKLFSPDNDLLYSPPNFFYSSLRWRSPTPQSYTRPTFNVDDFDFGASRVDNVNDKHDTLSFMNKSTNYVENNYKMREIESKNPAHFHGAQNGSIHMDNRHQPIILQTANPIFSSTRIHNITTAGAAQISTTHQTGKQLGNSATSTSPERFLPTKQKLGKQQILLMNGTIQDNAQHSKILIRPFDTSFEPVANRSISVGMEAAHIKKQTDERPTLLGQTIIYKAPIRKYISPDDHHPADAGISASDNEWTESHLLAIYAILLSLAITVAVLLIAAFVVNMQKSHQAHN